MILALCFFSLVGNWRGLDFWLERKLKLLLVKSLCSAFLALQPGSGPCALKGDHIALLNSVFLTFTTAVVAGVTFTGSMIRSG